MNEYIIIVPTRKEMVLLFRYTREVLRSMVSHWSSHYQYRICLENDICLNFVPAATYVREDTQGRRARILDSRYFEKYLDEYKERDGNVVV